MVPRVAASETTAGRHLRLPVTVGTRHVAAEAMIAGPHRHLALAETTVEVVTTVIIASYPPPDGIVGVATRSRLSRALLRECYERERERSPPRRESARD